LCFFAAVLRLCILCFFAATTGFWRFLTHNFRHSLCGPSRFPKEKRSNPRHPIRHESWDWSCGL